MEIMKKILLLILLSATFMACEKEESDPCEDIVCLNDGVCVDGTCDCPEGYWGNDCSIENTPSSITITKVTVVNFPSTDGGENWDPSFCGGSRADIFVIIVDANDNQYYGSEFYEDAVPGAKQEFTHNLPYTVHGNLNDHRIRLYDYDTGSCAPSDYIGGYIFNYHYSGENFPRKLTITNSSSNLHFELDLEYSF
jgi:hypothetical protein